ncbi:MAG TPA: hypothetical protein VKF35_10140 [Hyphomicrobiaceae bacterium]|nr:hypothetical protein [Hyphomicrobiaceae bacterium]
MVIYLFKDKNSDDVFAFSTDVTGHSIPPATANSEWMFIEALDTLRFPEPWDVSDFQYVLDHLAVDGFYLFQGEFIEPAPLGRAKPVGLLRH